MMERLTCTPLIVTEVIFVFQAKCAPLMVTVNRLTRVWDRNDVCPRSYGEFGVGTDTSATCGYEISTRRVIRNGKGTIGYSTRCCWCGQVLVTKWVSETIEFAGYPLPVTTT